MPLEARTEPTMPGRPAPRGAGYGGRRCGAAPGRLAVHGDAQAPARVGGGDSHHGEGLREFRPGATKDLGEGVGRVKDTPWPLNDRLLVTGELKWDGFRSLVSVDAGRMVLRSRWGTEMAPAFPEVVAGAAQLPDATALDGVM
jgi:hypothetical protein